MPQSPIRIAALFCGVVLAAGAAPAAAQSFGCQKVFSRDEILICEQPGLARLDEELAARFRQEFGRLDKDQQEAFKAHETQFVNARRRCRDNYRCVEQSYRNRIQELDNLLPKEAKEAKEAKETSPGDIPTRAEAEAARRPAQRTERSQQPERQSKPERTTVTVTTASSTPPVETAGSSAAGATAPAEPPAPRRSNKRHQKPGPAPEGESVTLIEREVPASGSSTPSLQREPVPEGRRPAIKWVDPPPAR